jgi:hypothetical protein
VAGVPEGCVAREQRRITTMHRPIHRPNTTMPPMHRPNEQIGELAATRQEAFRVPAGALPVPVSDRRSRSSCIGPFMSNLQQRRAPVNNRQHNCFLSPDMHGARAHAIWFALLWC